MNLNDRQLFNLIERDSYKAFQGQFLRSPPSSLDVLNDQKRNFLTQSIHSGSEEICKILCDIPELVNACDGTGRTPLEYAVKSENTFFFDSLIKAGADVNMQNSQTGNTPLHVTVRDEVLGFSKNDYSKKILFLGYDESITNNRGERSGDVAKRLGARVVEFDANYQFGK